MDPLKPVDPRRLGEIELHGVLGEGGMGKVYFGMTPDGERVAVKVIHQKHADNDEALARFDREIVALRMVQGPRVASLVAAASPDAERRWLAMEYVRGLTLSGYVKLHGSLAADVGAVLGELLVEALAAIHQAGLLHRDLKPSNILLGADGPRVIDFGLVALAEADVELTSTSETFGTPVCMPPEQVYSAKNLTAAADVYALGASLLFALTAHYPYQLPSKAAILHAVSDPNTLPDLSGLPPSMAPVVEAMIAFEPQARPTLAEAGSALKNVYAGGGWSVSAARVRLAAVTYMEQPDDPPVDIDPPKAPLRRRRRESRIPSAVVSSLADRLRSRYSRGGSL